MKTCDPLTGHDRDCPCEQCLDAALGIYFAEQFQAEPETPSLWTGVAAAIVAWALPIAAIVGAVWLFGAEQ